MGEVRVAWEALQRFTRDVFLGVGLPPGDAETEAEVLVWANLRGVDSHGVLRMPWYVEMVDAGSMKPRLKIRGEHGTAVARLKAMLMENVNRNTESVTREMVS